MEKKRKKNWYVWVLCVDAVYRMPMTEQEWKDDHGEIDEELQMRFGSEMLGWQVLQQEEPYGFGTEAEAKK